VSLADWQTKLSQALVLPLPLLRDAGLGDAQLPAVQGVDPQKLDLYRELMFNTVLESLESIFPFTHQLISEQDLQSESWTEFVDRYRRAYPNLSHNLMGAVENFPRFIAEQAELVACFPFVAELALYEWLEMQALNLPDQVVSDDLVAKKLPDLAHYDSYVPIWNEARVLHSFTFPVPDIVHALKEDEGYAHFAAQDTEILIYRDPERLQVRFFCLNGITSLLLRLSLAHPELSYQDLISQLQTEVPELQSLPLEIITEQAHHLFHHCLEVGVLLGSKSLYPDS